MTSFAISEFHENEFGEMVSPPLAVPAFGGLRCTFALVAFAADPSPSDLLDAVKRVVEADERLLSDATPYVYEYCMDVLALLGDEAPQLVIRELKDVWRYVDLGSELVVTRDHPEGRETFVSMECNCEWESEHGLQLVFKNGSAISRVSMYDGHVSNRSAFADPALEGVIYKRIGR